MRSLAKRFKVSFYFIYSLLKQVKQTGEIAPKPHGGGHPSSVEAQGQAFLKGWVDKKPDLTLEEIRDDS